MIQDPYHAGVTNESDELTARVATLEGRIAYLYARFGVDPAAAEQVELPVPTAILELVREGKEVAAIKNYRGTFGSSLGDATRAIRGIKMESQK